MQDYSTTAFVEFVSVSRKSGTAEASLHFVGLEVEVMAQVHAVWPRAWTWRGADYRLGVEVAKRAAVYAGPETTVGYLRLAARFEVIGSDAEGFAILDRMTGSVVNDGTDLTKAAIREVCARMNGAK